MADSGFLFPIDSVPDRSQIYFNKRNNIGFHVIEAFRVDRPEGHERKA